ncbi:MAG: TonB family protein [Nitrospirota bacterium]
MKGPSLQKTAALSAALHLTILVLSLIILRNPHNIVIPSPYIVSLVPPGKEIKGPADDVRSSAKVPEPAPSMDKHETKDKKEDKIGQNIVEDRISELKAKKKIEQIVKLRSIVSIKGAGEQNRQQATTQNISAGHSKGTIFNNYYSKITGEIWQEWIYPDLGENNLETIIFVKIMKDGTIHIQGIEKSSGNALFDRSALKALAKATPVSPPPYEMEIGIRFYP